LLTLFPYTTLFRSRGELEKSSGGAFPKGVKHPAQRGRKS
jgi:hypothetical protein